MASISYMFYPFVFRACKVLASHLKDLTFASAFIQHSSAAIDILKSLAKDCSTGNEMQSILFGVLIALLNLNVQVVT